MWRDRDRQCEDSHGKTEAERGVMLSGAKEAWNHRKLEEARTDRLLEASGRSMTLPAPWFHLQNCERINSLVLSHWFVVLCSCSPRKLIIVFKTIHTAGVSRTNILLLKVPSLLSCFSLMVTLWHKADFILHFTDAKSVAWDVKSFPQVIHKYLCDLEEQWLIEIPTQLLPG